MDAKLVEKAKAAKNSEELIKLADENGMELTEESANAYYALLHPQSGEMSDDELSDVSGGACHKKGKRVVTLLEGCANGFLCKRCGYGGGLNASRWDQVMTVMACPQCGSHVMCGHCKYCRYEKGLWLCNNPEIY